MSGTLYIVASPIGNMDDMTLRGIATLREVPVIACEDTRQAMKLLSKYGIAGKPCISYHNFNERTSTDRIIKHLEMGEDVGFVTDAGTPLISDPGFYLVREAAAKGINILPVPGVSALTTVLSVSPIPVNRFYFEGFLPHAKGRQKRLKYLATLDETTLIFYESPHRIIKFLGEVVDMLGDRKIFIGREMTKKFEEYLYGSASEVLAILSARKIQGEFVVVVGGISKSFNTPNDLESETGFPSNVTDTD